MISDITLAMSNYQKHSNKNNPIFMKINTGKTPSQIFSLIQNQFETAYLLESAVGPKKLAEFSFIGFGPKKTIVFNDKIITITNNETTEVIRLSATDLISDLRSILCQIRLVDQSIRLLGGAIGYISYDAIRYWERIPDKNSDKKLFPDAEFAVYDDGIFFNHKTNESYYYYIGKNRLNELDIKSKHEEPELIKYSNITSNINQSQYENIVLKAKDYIDNGEIFQVVLSRRLETTTTTGDLHSFYNVLREINPSPYMYHLKMGERRIIGSSPEMLVRVVKDSVETFPIAGTRSMNEDDSYNRKMAKDLLADPKDRSEHIMLVDLARNDIGKISRYGTVKTNQFMQIHQFSHVQHIVSHVKGKLKPEIDSYDALKAVFPAGTVSGAPKVRAMEIIDELEQIRRGPYAGAIGYFSYNGNSDFAITIRTLTALKNKIYIQAGAGIVADSDPKKEWIETQDKLACPQEALKLAANR